MTETKPQNNMETNTETSEEFAEKFSVADPMVVDSKPVVPMEQTLTAKHNCRHCHGRGFIGTNVETRAKIPCRCLRPANKSTVVQGKPVDSKTGW